MRGDVGILKEKNVLTPLVDLGEWDWRLTGEVIPAIGLGVKGLRFFCDGEVAKW